MKDRFVLLVEDNPDDVALTLRALRRSHISNEVIVATDGVEALNFLFCKGAYASRDPDSLPELILLDLRCQIKIGIWLTAFTMEPTHIYKNPLSLINLLQLFENLVCT